MVERIYIVEDEPRLRSELSNVLMKNGYECILAEQFEHVTEDILAAAPDLVLLDLCLPVYDGFYICRNLREASDIPVIVVTSSDSDMDELMMGILKLLLDHKGSIVSRDELIRELWEMEEFVEDSTLTVNINRLRKKLADMGLIDYLVTKRGQGYLV